MLLIEVSFVYPPDETGSDEPEKINNKISRFFLAFASIATYEHRVTIKYFK